jgi:predicted RNA-binding protein
MRTETGRVKVYRFRLYDIASDEFRISNRMATAARIRRIHAEPIKRASMEIDRKTSMPME